MLGAGGRLLGAGGRRHRRVGREELVYKGERLPAELPLHHLHDDLVGLRRAAAAARHRLAPSRQRLPQPRGERLGPDGLPHPLLYARDERGEHGGQQVRRELQPAGGLEGGRVGGGVRAEHGVQQRAHERGEVAGLLALEVGQQRGLEEVVRVEPCGERAALCDGEGEQPVARLVEGWG
eukprot:scaffold123972_cov63-Phaeocystis_antarctica.AAC.2